MIKKSTVLLRMKGEYFMNICVRIRTSYVLHMYCIRMGESKKERKETKT